MLRIVFSLKTNRSILRFVWGKDRATQQLFAPIEGQDLACGQGALGFIEHDAAPVCVRFEYDGDPRITVADPCLQPAG